MDVCPHEILYFSSISFAQCAFRQFKIVITHHNAGCIFSHTFSIVSSKVSSQNSFKKLLPKLLLAFVASWFHLPTIFLAISLNLANCAVGFNRLILTHAFASALPMIDHPNINQKVINVDIKSSVPKFVRNVLSSILPCMYNSTSVSFTYSNFCPLIIIGLNVFCIHSFITLPTLDSIILPTAHRDALASIAKPNPHTDAQNENGNNAIAKTAPAIASNVSNQ